jgi:hypothetical protein
MTKGKYIEQVLLRMNEASHEGITSVFGSDTTNVPTFIINTFGEAWRRIVEILPVHYFPQKSFTNPIADLDRGIGTLYIPEDFEKFASLQMKGWKKPVLEAVFNTDYVAELQANENTRGSWIRPVVVIDNMNTTLTYYSLPKWFESHEIQSGFYVPKAILPATDTDQITIGTKTIEGKYAEPLMWLHASIIFDIFGKTDYSKICKENILNK